MKDVDQSDRRSISEAAVASSTGNEALFFSKNSAVPP